MHPQVTWDSLVKSSALIWLFCIVAWTIASERAFLLDRLLSRSKMSLIITQYESHILMKRTTNLQENFFKARCVPPRPVCIRGCRLSARVLVRRTR